ncbi:MAG: dephospho-CoA kinase [Ruminococcaceae bacterium]|nr:dephospho-CoA kinase [Oscillospiraceae bacterium]
MNNIYKVAVTGNSGSGKSLACRYLKKKGIPVIDADLTARITVDEDIALRVALAKAFGNDVLFEDGSLNRKELAKRAFSTKDNKNKMDGILHPKIIENINKEIQKLSKAGSRVCVVEAAALYESGFVGIFDFLILITAEHNHKLKRIMLRDAISEEDAENRLKAQTPDADIKTIADLIIENSGEQNEFINKLERAMLIINEKAERFLNERGIE